MHRRHSRCIWRSIWDSQDCEAHGRMGNSAIGRDWPRAFCWTKMQAESGQELASILARKDAERRATGGFFLWGIGNSLGDKLARLRRREPHTLVLFSVCAPNRKKPMLPPGSSCIWTHCRPIAESGPGTIGRGHTDGRLKKAHYALVCFSGERVERRSRGDLDVRRLQNIGSANPRIGSSQVTTVVERKSHDTQCGSPAYRIDMVAGLVGLGIVRLSGAVPLTHAEQSKLDGNGGRDWEQTSAWIDCARELRGAALKQLNTQTKSSYSLLNYV